MYRGIHTISDTGCSITIDTTHLPIVITRVAGDTNKAIYDKYWSYRDEFLTNLYDLVIFVNEIGEMKPLEALTRKYVAEKAKNDPKIQQGLFTNVMIVTNPILRGVLTAMTWMVGKDKFPMALVSNVHEGFRTAARLLEERGIQVPELPEHYELPEIGAGRKIRIDL